MNPQNSCLLPLNLLPCPRQSAKFYIFRAKEEEVHIKIGMNFITGITTLAQHCF